MANGHENYGGVRHFQTYAGWLRATKQLAKKHSINPFFTGDKDINGCYLDGIAECEWDGASGTIEPLEYLEVL